MLLKKCVSVALLATLVACTGTSTRTPAPPPAAAEPLPVAVPGDEVRHEIEPLPATAADAAAQSGAASASAAVLAAGKRKAEFGESRARPMHDVLREQKMYAAPSALPHYPPSLPPPAFVDQNRERYDRINANPVHRVADAPVSTFSVDVDTGAYANVRRFLQQGQLPPADAVRVEELVNYFDYRYDAPRDRETPFSVTTEIAPTPWNRKTQLLHVGIQGWVPDGPRPASNLVFLIDVSGSMVDADKLPLVKAALKLLTRELTAKDRISLVVYAGATGIVLEPTPGDQRARIHAAIDQLGAGGATNGAAGITLAYQMAEQAFIRNGVNRVLLATDGDFNVGTTNFDELLKLVEDKRRSGVALTTLGFGQGNYNEQLMEQLADHGNGNYAYIDSLSEAQKVLVRQRDATLQTIARDVKVQIEFNPALVAEYRLVGYENRLLRREDFSNDKIDAGEIGAGHRVTAIYEIALAGQGGERIQSLRYGKTTAAPVNRSGELAHLRLRYKRPQDGMAASSRLIERPLYPRDISARWETTSDAFRLSAAVAAFGQLLRGGEYTEGFDYTQVRTLAQSARGRDDNGEAGEFLRLVELADALTQHSRRDTPMAADGG